MMKCEIHLDEEKIIADGIYTPKQIWDTIDRMFACNELVKAEKGIYLEGNQSKNLERFMGTMLTLKDKKWFMDYVDKWYWYHDESISDIIKTIHDFNAEEKARNS